MGKEFNYSSFNFKIFGSSCRKCPLGLVLCYALLLCIVAGGSVRTVLELAELKIFQQTVWFEQYFKQQKRQFYLTTLNEKN
jgi:hypothetical protein